ncbi:hypothetical protein ASF21_10030 [Arthrobacter sp. Leaf234]|uniref:serine/threonine-protein kinase n=1 Tax=Arthrobacter sp. Leaf234 TaxID=1736303 RepID=UPI0006FF99B7|nr:serine/threonine-protein kinase [Arthrobacter sp. Leaf234]KQO01886.1 hypothetical protein ASF21_10030 [Arthrobacter sp. Leaf234]
MEQQALAGRYALGKRVGTGGMAEVFTARDTRLGRDVAVKLFRPGTADGLERGSAEARMLARLDHPGLVRVLDMDNGEDAQDGAYLVMELVDGPDLGVRLRTSGPLGREEVRTMALDLARTLQYIHGQGIVHRDLKPSNILTREADPHSGLFGYLLTDFGIARFFDGGRMTATGQVIGSAAYFSPEQARGDGVGRPSDIYSLGLVLIEALTGERAFPGTGIESALARLHRSPSIPHAAGPALSALLISMALDDPDDRPDAAGVVRALTVMGPQRGADASGASRGPAGTSSTEVPAAAWTAPGPRGAASPEPRTAAMPVAAGPSASLDPHTAVLPPAAERAPSPDARTAAVPAAVESPSSTHPRTAVLPAPELPSPSPLPSTAVPARPAPAVTALPAPSDRVTDSVSGLRRVGAAERPWSDRAPDTAQQAQGVAPTRVSDAVDQDHPDGAGETRDPRPSSRPVLRRSALPWVLALLAVLALAAAGLWIMMTMTADGSPPGIEPLPAVPGEPGERLQELYESVQ